MPLAALLLGLLLLALPALADPSDLSLDDILGGFAGDESEIEETASPEPSAEQEGTAPSLTNILSTSIGASYNVRHHRSSLGPPPNRLQGTDYSGLQRLRLRIDLQTDVFFSENWRGRFQGFTFYDFAYSLHGSEHYTRDVIDDYRIEAEILDFWLEGSLTSFLDVKLGRQVVNWGRSDSLRVTDIWNPLNNREPGLVDIEELRLPLGILRLDAYWKQWQLTALVVPEIRYDYDPPPGSDFFPLTDPQQLPAAPPSANVSAFIGSLFATSSLEDRETEGWTRSPEYGGALTGIFRGWDISFYAARIYDNRPMTVMALPNPIAAEVYTTHDRITMLGAGGNYARGNWLLKAEIAYFDGLDFVFLRPNPNFTNPASDLPYTTDRLKISRIDWMVGIEYYGINDVTVALEVAHRHLMQYDSLLRKLPNYTYQNSIESALRISSQHMNARLELNALGMVLLNDAGLQGGVLRFWGNYEVREALHFTAGYLHFFASSQPPFDSWNQNDRLFAKLKFSFQ
jgi:hypothetical protein